MHLIILEYALKLYLFWDNWNSKREMFLYINHYILSVQFKAVFVHFDDSGLHNPEFIFSEN